MSAALLPRRALITGASGGIGYELARVFAKEGWELILVARGISKMNALAEQLTKSHGVSVIVIEKDLSMAASSQELFQETQSRGLHVDALVNNAGFGSFGPFSGSDIKTNTDMLELNIVTLTKLTKLYLGPMLQNKKGWILNVASTAAFQPGPLMAVYYASKAYVLSFSEALANEVKDAGISVTALCPGATETGFRDAAQMGQSKLFKKRVMLADRVAQEGYRGMVKRKVVVIPGLKNNIMASSVRFAPRSIVPSVVRKITEAKH